MAAALGTVSIAYRAATETDIEAEHAVFASAEGDLLERHGFGWAEAPSLDRVAPILRHLRRHDADRCFVATAEDKIVGFSAALERDETWFLAAMFVEPTFQGRGIGRRLFEFAFEGAPARRITITDAIQPVSNALYAMHGLLPTTPILTFEGRRVPGAPTDLVAAPPTALGLAQLDALAYGFDRAVDHGFWATEATPTLWLRNGAPVAYSYRWSNGRIGPLAGADEVSAAAALRAELARQDEPWVEIPGTSRTLVETALAAGMRIAPPPGLLLLADGAEPPRSLAISSYFLF